MIKRKTSNHKTMTVQQAAKVIGCHPAHVRKLLTADPPRLKGKLRASPTGNVSWWELDPKSVRAYANREQTGGWPRGVSRT